MPDGEIIDDGDVVAFHHFFDHVVHLRVVVAGMVFRELPHNQSFQAGERSVEFQRIKHAFHFVDFFSDIFDEKDAIAFQQIVRRGYKPVKHGKIPSENASFRFAGVVQRIGFGFVCGQFSGKDASERLAAFVVGVFCQVFAHWRVDARHAIGCCCGMERGDVAKSDYPFGVCFPKLRRKG